MSFGKSPRLYQSSPREKNPNWKGGFYVDERNMKRILMPEHPRADTKGYLREYILLAEKTLGKSLPKKAVIHHHSENQLVICENQGYHLHIHARQRRLNGFVPKKRSYYPESRKKYRERNKERLRKYYAAYREKNRERIREYNRNWWRKNHATS